MNIKRLLNSCSSLLFLCSIAYSSTGSAVTVTSGSLSPLLFDTEVEINKNEYCETPELNACNVSGATAGQGTFASSHISIVVGGGSNEAIGFTEDVIPVTTGAASSYTSGETIFKAPFTYNNSENTEGEFVSQGLITGTITSVGQAFSAQIGAHALFAIRAEVFDTATNEMVGGADIMGETCTTEIVNDLDIIPSPCLNHFNNTIPVSFLVSLRKGHEYELQISSSCETRFSYTGLAAWALPGLYYRIAQCTGQVNPVLDWTDPAVITTANKFSLYVGPDIEGYLAGMIAKLNNLDTTVSSRATQASLDAVALIATEINTRLVSQQAALIAKLDGIKGQVSQHDNEIKSRLLAIEANISGKLLELEAKTEEVIRLVKTPEGLRRK